MESGSLYISIALSAACANTNLATHQSGVLMGAMSAFTKRADLSVRHGRFRQELDSKLAEPRRCFEEITSLDDRLNFGSQDRLFHVMRAVHDSINEDLRLAGRIRIFHRIGERATDRRNSPAHQLPPPIATAGDEALRGRTGKSSLNQDVGLCLWIRVHVGSEASLSALSWPSLIANVIRLGARRRDG